MRTVVFLVLLGLLGAGCSAVTPGAQVPEDHWTREPGAVPMMRIGRGVTNIVLSPAEVFATMWRVAEEYDEFGYGAGIGQGVFNGGARLIFGAGEALTFFLINEPDPAYPYALGERIIFRDTYRPAEDVEAWEASADYRVSPPP